MAGFIDKDTRILDMVLTNHGKQLLSEGSLNFCYWTPFDDEIDYDPFILSSSLLSEEDLLSATYSIIENSPVKEAVSGYRLFNKLCLDNTNVLNPIFTMVQGQSVLPRSSISGSANANFVTEQQRTRKVFIQPPEGPNGTVTLDPIDIGIKRTALTDFSVDMLYSNDSFPTDFQTDGFSISVLKSGSSGYYEVDARFDLQNELAFSNDVNISILTGSLES